MSSDSEQIWPSVLDKARAEAEAWRTAALRVGEDLRPVDGYYTMTAEQWRVWATREIRRLIASAPDLLAALKACEAYPMGVERVGGRTPAEIALREVICAALAKAAE